MTEFENKRVDRVAQLLQQELAQLLINEIKDPRVGFATVTEVRLSGDMRTARVFVSVYGSEEERENTLQGLTAAVGFVKRELGRRLRLKHMPDLSFACDRSLDRVERLDQLFEAVRDGEIETPAPRGMEKARAETQRSDMVDASRVLEEAPKPQKQKKSRRAARRRGLRRRR